MAQEVSVVDSPFDGLRSGVARAVVLPVGETTIDVHLDIGAALIGVATFADLTAANVTLWANVGTEESPLWVKPTSGSDMTLGLSAGTMPLFDFEATAFFSSVRLVFDAEQAGGDATVYLYLFRM